MNADSKISGAGVISGGEYDSINIAGSGKVTCTVVSGKNIKIGDGCVIEKLVYSSEADISSSAAVKSVEKLQ